MPKTIPTSKRGAKLVSFDEPLVGLPVRTAAKRLATLGIQSVTWLNAEFKPVSPADTAGVVVWQHPGPQAAFDPNTEVTLLFGASPIAPVWVTVPDFALDVTVTAAQAHAASLGLSLTYWLSETNQLPGPGGDVVVSNHPDTPPGSQVRIGGTAGVIVAFRRH